MFGHRPPFACRFALAERKKHFALFNLSEQIAQEDDDDAC